jgi:hypothetical protein
MKMCQEVLQSWLDYYYTTCVSEVPLALEHLLSGNVKNVS